MSAQISNQIDEHFQMHKQMLNMGEEIKNVVTVITEALAKGNKVLICGNGGSAADAQHFAAELVGRFKLERRAYAAIALTTDTSVLTAIGNDYGYANVFERQVQALAKQGDVVIGFSTSGNSENVLKAIDAANVLGCKTVGFLGQGVGLLGGLIRSICTHNLCVPTRNTPNIQEMHMLMVHIICDLVEKVLLGREQGDNSSGKKDS